MRRDDTSRTPIVRRKPRLVFFQWDHRPNAESAAYLLLHMQQQVKCLAAHFDVVVINEDCDYADICERFEADLALFESGYRSHGSRRIAIRNTDAHPQIPKAGLHNGDPWCDRRAGFLSDMEHWGIETFFSISTLMPAYTPEITGNLFIWPNSIDPDIYHDYGQAKAIPVMLTGQAYGLYPWRQRVFPLIRDRYPCLVSPQHSYESRVAASLLSGKAYARAINASFVVPTCGTAGGEVVRKHFEIPAAGSCLVTERSPGLDEAGFVDMVNCVFADAHDIVDRLEYLFANPDELRRITWAGHDLVHSRHTLNHRPQIRQWFDLQSELASDEEIIQSGPFGSLERVKRSEGRTSRHPPATGIDRAAIREGDHLLLQQRFAEAREAYGRSLDIVSYSPEARFGLARTALGEGDPIEARDQLVRLIEVTTVDYGAADPDPVEWAYFLLALVCSGGVARARRLQWHYPRLSHEELQRAHDVLRRLAPAEGDGDAGRAGAGRPSVHILPERSDEEWLAWFADVLDRCQQRGLATQLREGPDAGSAPPAASRRDGDAILYSGLDRLLAACGLGAVRPNVPPLPEFRYLHRMLRRTGGILLRGRLGSLRSSLLAARERMRRWGRRPRRGALLPSDALPRPYEPGRRP